MDPAYGFLQDQMTWTIGVVVGFFLTGNLFTLGISCIFLLARGKQRVSKQHLFLRVYVITLLFFVVIFEVEEFLRPFSAVIFYFQPPEKQYEILDILMILTSLTPIAISALTDGLLVWRCFMLRGWLRHHSLPAKYGCIVWIFPACLLSLIIITGCIGGGLLFVPSTWYLALSYKLQATALVSNVALNIYATVLIIALLLIHRRIVRRCRGITPSRNTDLRTQHIPLVVILLESAAINVPVTIVVAVGISTEGFFGTVIVPIAVASQALASMLIIHQVALGRAYDCRRGEDPENAVQTTVGLEGPNSRQGIPDDGVLVSESSLQTYA